MYVQSGHYAFLFDRNRDMEVDLSDLAALPRGERIVMAVVQLVNPTVTERNTIACPECDVLIPITKKAFKTGKVFW